MKKLFSKSHYLFFLSLIFIFSACRKKVMSPYEFALLSADVYDNDYVSTLPKHLQKFLDFEESGYLAPAEKKESSSGEESTINKLAKTIYRVASAGGYFGRAYVNQSNQQVIIAHRGTDFDFENTRDISINRILKTIKDIDDDISVANGEIPHQHFDAALHFTKKVRAEYKKQYGKTPTIIHTGHSLGAVLAQLCAVKENQKAITFESPGVYPMVEKLLDKKNIDAKAFDVTIYNGARNPINSVHPQIGKVIQLDKDSSQVSLDGLSINGKNINVNMKSHYMTNILEAFNPKTGQPKISSEVEAH